MTTNSLDLPPRTLGMQPGNREFSVADEYQYNRSGAARWYRRVERGEPVRNLPRARDYYRIEDEAGRRYWVFRRGLYDDGRGGPPEWFVHGLFA